MGLLDKLFNRTPPPAAAPMVGQRSAWLSCSDCGGLGVRTFSGRNYGEIQTAIDAALTAHNNTHPAGVCSSALELP